MNTNKIKQFSWNNDEQQSFDFKKSEIVERIWKNKEVTNVLDFKKPNNTKTELEFMEEEVIRAWWFTNLKLEDQRKLKKLRLEKYENYRLFELRKMKATEPMTQRELNELDKLEKKYESLNSDLTKFAQELFDSKAA